jgi:hypothetical protein
VKDKVDSLYGGWMRGKTVDVVNDLVQMDKRPAMLCSLELMTLLDESDQKKLIRMLKIKFLDRG